MATIVQLPPDPRVSAISEGVGEGVDNFFAERRRKKLAKKFDEAFERINQAASYEEAVASMSDIDAEILTDKDAIGMLSEQIGRRFPEQEKEEVFDPKTRLPTTITHPKGQPLSDKALATKGLTRKSSAGIGTHFIFDEESGDIEMAGKTTREEAEKKADGRLVLSEEDVPSGTSLMKAFADLQSAAAQKKAAETSAQVERRTPQFDQEVQATAQRLGLDYNNPEQRNQAISVKTNYEPVRKGYMELLTKNVGTQIVLNASDTGGPVAIGASLIEPVLADGGSPAEAQQAAYAGFAWSALNQRATDPDGKSTVFEPQMRTRLAAEFATITGFAHNDPDVQKAVKQVTAEGSLQPGQSGIMDIYDANGRHLGAISLANINGRIIPIGGLRGE